MDSNVDQNILRRQLAMDKAQDQADSNDGDEEDEGFGSTPARALARVKSLSKVATAKSKGSDDLQRELFDSQVKKVAVEAAKRATLRLISWGAAATFVGLIVTYLIYSFQEIGHHWLGAKWIPGLSPFERGLWLASTLLLIVIIVGLVALCSVALAISSPVTFLQYLGQELLDKFTGLFKK